MSVQSAPAPWSKTVIVTIVPRYLVINKLGHPVCVRQVLNLDARGNNKAKYCDSLELAADPEDRQDKAN